LQIFQRADVKSNQSKRPIYKEMMIILTSGFSKTTTENSSHWNKTTKVMNIFTVMLEYLIGDALLTDKN